MDTKRIQEIQAECANHIVAACGETGVLESVDNNKLTGDLKVRHKNAMKEVERFKDKNGIFAHIYGLI